MTHTWTRDIFAIFSTLGIIQVNPNSVRKRKFDISREQQKEMLKVLSRNTLLKLLSKVMQHKKNEK